MIDKINGAAFKEMVLFGAACIAGQKQAINDLNVFPVPDGDTGTNMYLTIQTACAELKKAEPATIDDAAKVTARGLLRGARGNSGVILSLLFRGMSKSLKGLTEADGAALAAAMQEGVATAYGAVMKPAEGTVLTVSRLAAQRAAEAAQENNSVEFVLEEAIRAGEVTLAETVEMNPVLKKAGVVDAGGKGYLIILDGMLRCLRGEAIPEVKDEPEVKEKADFASLEDEITFTFDTVFIVRKTMGEKSLEPLRAYLDSIGDSLVIGEDDECFKVHVHTDIPGHALTEAQKYGTLELAKIENMRTQRDDLAAGRQAHSTDDLDAVEAELEEQENAVAPAEKRYGFVAVCAGDGLADTFRALGVDTIVSGGQTMNPSTEDILAAIQSVPAKTVFVLPNNKNIIMAAEQAEKLADRQVVVLPTRTVPMGITAMLNFDPSVNAETNTINMMAAADKVSTGLITYAARDSEYDGKRIKKGEIMALENGKIVSTSTDITKATYRLARGMCKKDSSFVTIISGCDVSDEDAEKVTEMVKAKCPNHVEVSHIRGGQPVYYYMISVE